MNTIGRVASIAVLIVLSVWGAVLPARAAPIPYVIEFTIIEVGSLGTVCPDRIDSATYEKLQFDCDVAAGDRFVGTFSLYSSEILNGPDGARGGYVSHFFAQIGGVIWSQDFPWTDSAYLGTMASYPIPPNFFPPDPGPDYTRLGFEIADGELTSIVSYRVFGPADVVDIFFDLATPRTFVASSIDGGYLSGNYTLRRVPEPSSLALLGVGLAGLAFTRRRKLESAAGSAMALNWRKSGASALKFASSLMRVAPHVSRGKRLPYRH